MPSLHEVGIELAAGAVESTFLLILGFTLFIVGFYINNKSDHILIKLRTNNTNEYKIPRGFLFEKITCPNYFGEIIEWLGFFLEYIKKKFNIINIADKINGIINLRLFILSISVFPNKPSSSILVFIDNIKLNQNK